MGIKKKDKVIVLCCGGTIEKTYDEFEGSLINRESNLRERLFNKLRLPHIQLVIKSIMYMDSLYMKDEHRDLLLSSIKLELAESAPIIVIHGTDTMDQSASFVEKGLGADLNVPIIFTGAMKPLELVDTDAKQNVVEALMASKLAGPGVYVSFHGKLFPAMKAKKNHEKATFEEIQ